MRIRKKPVILVVKINQDSSYTIAYISPHTPMGQNCNMVKHITKGQLLSASAC